MCCLETLLFFVFDSRSGDRSGLGKSILFYEKNILSLIVKIVCVCACARARVRACASTLKFISWRQFGGQDKRSGPFQLLLSYLVRIASQLHAIRQVCAAVKVVLEICLHLATLKTNNCIGYLFVQHDLHMSTRVSGICKFWFVLECTVHWTHCPGHCVCPLTG